MNYRYYRIIDKRPIRTHQATNLVHKTPKNIDLIVRDEKFSRANPILLLDLSAWLVEEAATLEIKINERKIIACLSHLLTKNSEQHLPSDSINSYYSGLIYWKDAVKYLLRTYTTKHSIREAVEH